MSGPEDGAENRPLRVLCDVGGIDEPDLGTIDMLARLCLAAKDREARVVLVRVSDELWDLLGFTGVRAVMGSGRSSIQFERQSEHREHPRGVEEEAELGDTSI